MIRGGVWLVLVGVAAAAVWYAAALRSDLVQARAELDQARAAVAAVDRFAREQAARDAEAAALDVELQQGVGADAPLSDYLRGAVSRVW